MTFSADTILLSAEQAIDIVKKSCHSHEQNQEDIRLFASANALREKYFANHIELCAIINARCGNCDMDCLFCVQSKHSTASVEKFPLMSDELLRQRILKLAATPVRHIGLVTSGGTLPARDVERLQAVCASLIEECPSLKGRLCGSLGKLGAEAMQSLQACGITRIHHNLECGEQFYASICTTQKWSDRAATISRATDLGLEVCAGGLFGLGETWDDRIALAEALNARQVKNVPLNFFVARQGTPMADMQALTSLEALRIIALFRHLMPTATLRVCGGRPQILQDRQSEIFHAGANALMTGDYLTTHGYGIDHDVAMIEELGLAL
ncbi:MAG: biotin synthase BioB [Pseudomonadota bacterium]